MNSLMLSLPDWLCKSEHLCWRKGLFVGVDAIIIHWTTLMQERTKEHNMGIRLARSQTSAVSEHAHESSHSLISGTRTSLLIKLSSVVNSRLKEAIHLRLHPYNNINRDSGIEIPEAWMPEIKIHNNRRTGQQWTAEVRDETMGGSKWTNNSQPLWYKWCRVISPPRH